MAQTTFGQLTTFGDLGDLRFPVFRMTISEMMGAVLKGIGSLQSSINTLSSSPMSVNLSTENLASIANSVLAYDIAELDDDTTKYNLDNLIRSRLLCSVTNNHNSNGDTLTTLTTEGETKTVFNKTTNKRGEMEGIE